MFVRGSRIITSRWTTETPNGILGKPKANIPALDDAGVSRAESSDATWQDRLAALLHSCGRGRTSTGYCLERFFPLPSLGSLFSHSLYRTDARLGILVHDPTHSRELGMVHEVRR